MWSTFQATCTRRSQCETDAILRRAMCTYNLVVVHLQPVVPSPITTLKFVLAEESDRSSGGRGHRRSCRRPARMYVGAARARAACLHTSISKARPAACNSSTLPRQRTDLFTVLDRFASHEAAAMERIPGDLVQLILRKLAVQDLLSLSRA